MCFYIAFLNLKKRLGNIVTNSTCPPFLSVRPSSTNNVCQDAPSVIGFVWSKYTTALMGLIPPNLSCSVTLSPVPRVHADHQQTLLSFVRRYSNLFKTPELFFSDSSRSLNNFATKFYVSRVL